MTKDLSRRTFLGILGGLVAGAIAGFKVDASHVIEEVLETPREKVYRTFAVKDFYKGNEYAIEYRVSEELLADCKIDLEKYIRQELTNAMAIEMDKWNREMEAEFIFGTGSGKPIGIIGASR